LEGLGVVLGIAGPFALKLLVDALYDGQKTTVWLGSMVGLFVMSWAGANVLAVWRMVHSTRVIDRLTEQLASQALRGALPEAVRQKQADSGQTAGQLERLPFSLMVVVDGLIWRAVPLWFQVLGSLVLIAGLIPFHYAITMAVVLFGYVLATWLGAVQHQRHANVANLAASDVSRHLADILRNARRVVMNGTTDMEIDFIKGQFAAKIAANTHMMWALVRTSVGQYGLVGLGLVVLLGLGCRDVVLHGMTVGDFVLLQAYAFRLASPLSGFGFILSQAAISISNISDVMARAGQIENDEIVMALSPGPASVALRSVSFSYGQGLPGLQDITADIAPGAFVVIVGPNGSGKSTLAQLIAGILEPSSGQVWIGDELLSEVPRRARHHKILYVPQLTGLFARSMLSNALYPPTAQTEHGLADLLAQWNFYEAGRQVDLRLEVGEQGERLSGGQIQKLELARIAGIKVPVILLDESTSALDPASEEAVISTLRQSFGGQTTLILITHRIRLAELADQILFLKGGKLLRHGTHEALLKDSAAYASLWTSAKP
jgi:ABC-type bacteriocin/lantibiotic exporter with double-glycine peptidase domain